MRLLRSGDGARPVMLAVGGDSGTGKTTLTRGIYEIFGEENILNICLDDYHTLDREEREHERVTALNPVANNIQLMEEHVRHLREGRTIVKPVYDHSTGKFGDPEVVRPRPIIIIRGLFPLLTQRLRSMFDVRVWLDPEDALKYHWKLQRDVAQRGYVVEQVIAQIIHRQDDLRQFILPQARHADIVVRFMTSPGYFERRRTDGADRSLPVRLIQRRTLPPIDLSGVISEEESAIGVLRQFDEHYQGEPATVVELGEDVQSEAAGRIEDRLWDHMPSHKALRPPAIGTFLEEGRTARRSHPLAIAQLLLACRVATARDAQRATVEEAVV
jgi:phosphoribulokinase